MSRAVSQKTGIRQSSDGVARVLIVGETGSGKSTFINYLTNYFRGGSLTSIKVAIKSKYHPFATEGFSNEHSEAAVGKNAESQTSDCYEYAFTDRSTGRKFVFLDTPGMSDTRGPDQDDTNMEKIIDAIIKLGGLSAVIIVINGTAARITANMRNVLGRLRGNLPDVILEHLIVVLSNSKAHETNFELNSLKFDAASNVYPFHMQNSAFSSDPKKWDKRAMISLKADWQNSMLEIKDMVSVIADLSPKPVDSFTDMRQIRQNIKKRLHDARFEVARIQRIQDQLESLKSGMSSYDSEINANQSFTKTEYHDDTVLVDTSYHNTLCENCNAVCHAHCQLNEVPGEKSGDKSAFMRCACIANGQCKECPGKCSYTKHYHAKKEVQVQRKSTEHIIEEIKARYEAAMRSKGVAEGEIHAQMNQKQMLEAAIQQQKDEIRRLCVDLKKLCSGFNLVDELSSTITQLQMEAKQLNNLEARQKAQAFVESLNQLCRELMNGGVSSYGQQGGRGPNIVQRLRSDGPIDSFESDDDRHEVTTNNRRLDDSSNSRRLQAPGSQLNRYLDDDNDGVDQGNHTYPNQGQTHNQTRPLSSMPNTDQYTQNNNYGQPTPHPPQHSAWNNPSQQYPHYSQQPFSSPPPLHNQPPGTHGSFPPDMNYRPPQHYGGGPAYHAPWPPQPAPSYPGSDPYSSFPTPVPQPYGQWQQGYFPPHSMSNVQQSMADLSFSQNKSTSSPLPPSNEHSNGYGQFQYDRFQMKPPFPNDNPHQLPYPGTTPMGTGYTFQPGQMPHQPPYH